MAAAGGGQAAVCCGQSLLTVCSGQSGRAPPASTSKSRLPPGRGLLRPSGRLGAPRRAGCAGRGRSPDNRGRVVNVTVAVPVSGEMRVVDVTVAVVVSARGDRRVVTVTVTY